MTVMVTGASGPVGRALVPVLAHKDEVRAVVRRPESAEPLRRLGAKVAVGLLDDAGALAEVFKRVFTVIHLVGGPDQPDRDALWDANHGSVLRALAAAEEAGVRRFVLLSVPGASPDAADDYLRARGLAEEAVTNARIDHAVIRSTHVVAASSPWFTSVVAGAAATPPVVLGDGKRFLAPVALDDLVAVLAAVDDRAHSLGETWGLEGPDVVTADELCLMLAGSAARAPRHVTGADARSTLEALLGFSVSHECAVRFCDANRADAPDAASSFGIVPRPLTHAIEGTLRSLIDGAPTERPG